MKIDELKIRQSAASKRYYRRNRETCLGRARRYRERNRDAIRTKGRAQARDNSLAVHGLTRGEYDELLLRQGGVCFLCGTDQPKTVGGKHFAVDHDHSTGRVRGLLCGYCNVRLAALEDPLFKHRAEWYLRGHIYA